MITRQQKDHTREEVKKVSFSSSQIGLGPADSGSVHRHIHTYVHIQVFMYRRVWDTYIYARLYDVYMYVCACLHRASSFPANGLKERSLQ